MDNPSKIIDIKNYPKKMVDFLKKKNEIFKFKYLSTQEENVKLWEDIPNIMILCGSPKSF